MSKFDHLFNESVRLFEAKKHTNALESFKTLLTLLQDERRKDEDMISRTLEYIEKMEPKLDLVMPKMKADKALQEQTPQYLNNLEEKANRHFAVNEYQLAANTYQSLAEIIQKYHPRKKFYLAETYWNEAMAHSALFQILEKEDPERAEQHKAKVKTLVENARSAYPKNHAESISACDSFLDAISPVTLPLASQKDETKALSDDEVSKKAGHEIDQAFAAIHAISKQSLPLETQYDAALAHIQKAMKLLSSKQSLSQADAENHFYCTTTRKQISHYFDTFGRTTPVAKENIPPTIKHKQELALKWKSEESLKAEQQKDDVAADAKSKRRRGNP